MPNRDQLAAAVSRELRAAVAAQRRRSDAAARFGPPWRDPEKRRLRWLYPLSGREGTEHDVSELMSGDHKPVTLLGFERLIRSRRFRHDPWLTLTANSLPIRAGDFVYFYMGDDDAGIIGFARAEAMGAPTPGAPEVMLRIDVPLSTRLIAQRPVPAAIIRRWLLPAERAVQDLTPFGQDLDRVLSHFPGYAKHLRQPRSGR